MTQAIDSFDGQYRWLSNFFPCRITFEGRIYPSVENAYQAAKTDDDQRGPFVDCSPGQAKRLGRRVTMRSDWERVKVSTMRRLLVRKFRDPVLATALEATGSAKLVEGNTWGDVFWGQCDGRGRNVLGLLLMEIRTQLGKNQND